MDQQLILANGLGGLSEEVAHLLDLAGSEVELSSLGPRRPMLAPADILYVAADNITSAEAKAMRSLDLKRIALAMVKEDPTRRKP